VPTGKPGKQGKAEALLRCEQMAPGRLRAEQKAPSETVSPPDWVLALPLFWCKVKQVS